MQYLNIINTLRTSNGAKGKKFILPTNIIPYKILRMSRLHKLKLSFEKNLTNFGFAQKFYKSMIPFMLGRR